MKIAISIFLVCYFFGFYVMQPSVQINSISKKEVRNKELSLQNNEFKEILHLPFGQKLLKRSINENFYWDLIYNNYGRLIQDGGFTQKTTRKIKRYKLPIIKSISYFDSTYKRNVTLGCLTRKSLPTKLY